MSVSGEKEGEVQMQGHDQISSEVITNIRAMWERIKAAPQEWLQDLDGSLAFVAGGGLPLVFGQSESKIYQAMSQALESNGGDINIAGVVFKEAEIKVLGDFYRFLQQKGYNLHCIDERLEDDLGNEDRQVHEHCGACAASHAAIEKFLGGEMHVEDLLLVDLGETKIGKQQIYESMPHHESLTVFIDFAGDDAIVDEAKRTLLRENHALSFQVSLPEKMIQEFLVQAGDSIKDSFLNALVKWNVQIARNIIGGDHNHLKQHASQTIFVVDKRGTDASELVFALMNRINEVQHAEKIIIED